MVGKTDQSKEGVQDKLGLSGKGDKPDDRPHNVHYVK